MLETQQSLEDRQERTLGSASLRSPTHALPGVNAHVFKGGLGGRAHTGFLHVKSLCCYDYVSKRNGIQEGLMTLMFAPKCKLNYCGMNLSPNPPVSVGAHDLTQGGTPRT